MPETESLGEGANPQASKRVFKIAPGENAVYWEDCKNGGYICVGWDDVGDLRQFNSRQEFKDRFFQEYLQSLYKDRQYQAGIKADELWTLRELKPGDLIIANQGIKKILARGEVIEPGYEWRDDRTDQKHVVHVKWDTSYAREIKPPQRRWAFLTVAPVSADLYNQLFANSGVKSPSKPLEVMIEPKYIEIADALERKGQVILYGPPGTGKTFTARRFAVWWLMKKMNDPHASATVADKTAAALAEEKLIVSSSSSKTWWVVANPGQSSWDTLPQDGGVAHQFGRLQKNYPLVRPNDLVIGYEAAPAKRITALASIHRGLHMSETGEPQIELRSLARVENGLTYDELAADSVLGQSEPMRFRNQGMLFALEEPESEHLLNLLLDRDPALENKLKPKSVVGHLTLLTFHGSYCYEDFIEGFRPIDRGTENLILRLQDGVFKRVCREAQLHPKEPFLVLIDEINRANITKVLGEIVTLFEKDKRGLVLTLPQSKDPFLIPENVFVLGTMNTADRSIKLLDVALRRRFAFVEFMSDASLLRGAEIGSLDLGEFLDGLNRRIVASADREKQIGHSYLFHDGAPISDRKEFGRTFRQEILPLLQEYCYDDYSTLADYIGEKLVNRKAQKLNMELLQNDDQLPEILAEELGKGMTPE
jgi:5-methylcytosine-specific restriction protein B